MANVMVMVVSEERKEGRKEKGRLNKSKQKKKKKPRKIKKKEYVSYCCVKNNILIMLNWFTALFKSTIFCYVSVYSFY